MKWRAWVEGLQNLKLVSWPHCFKPKEFGVLHNVQLHHFSDASEVRYGAASYLRLVDDKGRIHCGLIMAKSHVAPSKTVTLSAAPFTTLFLPLQAADVCRMVALIQESFTLPIQRGEERKPDS